ncbi:helix-turn-helix domain-containing protein [Streptomyces sp. NPDC058657]|uniref:helix-turn-helix domain-containing protein n=1 Tax=unclassified Streptomyces TaxID=2593676 RepID=UPI003658745B
MTARAQVGPSPVGGGPVVSLDLDDLVADIGDRIRAERQHRGWSQAELGTRAGIPTQYVGLAEAGNAALPVARLAQLCHGLGVSMGYLLADGWEMPERKAPVVALTSRQAQVLVEARSGAPLSRVAVRLGMSRESVSARLSEAYRVLGVSHLPHGGRREAAVRAAVDRGLLDVTMFDNSA